MEVEQPERQKATATNRGTWSWYFSKVVEDRKIIGLPNQNCQNRAQTALVEHNPGES